MKKKILAALLAGCMMIGIPSSSADVSVFAATSESGTKESEKEEEEFKISIWEDGTVSVFDYTGNDSKIEIPAQFEGHNTTYISTSLFSGYTKLLES